MKMYKTLHAEQRSALKLLSTRTFQPQEPSVTTTIRRSVLGQHNPPLMMLLPPGECNRLSSYSADAYEMDQNSGTVDSFGS